MMTTTIPPVTQSAPTGSTAWYRSKTAIIVIVVAALALAGVLTWLLSGSSTPSFGITTTSEVVAVTTGTIKETQSATGTIEPAAEATDTFAVSGTVTAVNVSAGQVVTVGQVLATINDSALVADDDQAAAEVAAAQDTYNSDKSAGASAATIESDEAQLQNAQSQLTTAKDNLADANLTATIAGTVASVDLTVGQSVSGGGGGGQGASAADSDAGSGSSTGVEIIATSAYIVNATVDDTVVGQIAQGDQAVITPSGSTTTDYGTVGSIGLIATDTSGVASFPVVIDVTGDPSGLFAGTSADISIITQQLNDVVEVPTAAINYVNDNATVTVVSGGRDRVEDVTVGAAADGETQITKGLRVGQKIKETVVKFTGRPTGVGGTGTFRSRLGGAGLGGGGFGGGGFGGGGFGGGGGF